MTGMRVELRYQAMPRPARPTWSWEWGIAEWSSIVDHFANGMKPLMLLINVSQMIKTCLHIYNPLTLIVSYFSE